MLTRRNAALAVLSGFVTTGFLDACSNSTGALIDPQVLADIQGIVPEAQAIVASVVAYAPKALSSAVQAQITAAAQAATAALASLSSLTAAGTGAATLQAIDNDINTILAAVGTVLPAIPMLASYVPLYDAVVALLPGIEAWVNSVIAPSTTKASARASLPVTAHLDPKVARIMLHIPTVK